MNHIPIFSMIAALTICVGTDAAPIEFNRDVRPILADRCFQCHGPDRHAREAELRLDQAGGEEGAYTVRLDIQAVSPGQLQNSEVWRRITSEDGDEVMPPRDSHKKPLTAAEQDIIKQWIEQGAKYATFWAFTPPAITEPQGGEWGSGPIDRYVAARLNAKSLRPSPEADKRTLLRRVTFDLTGLPPTLEELASFEADTAENAYEKRVDALLKRAQYGEHMTRYWADLVRLADTDGLHSDPYLDFSTYRSWVIRAFNANMPFDQFIRDQVAGDLYEEPTVDQQIASGFNRLNLMFVRGSVLPEESLFKVSSMASLGGLDQRDTLRDGFVEASRWYRNYVWEEIFGKVDQECLPLNARSRKYHEDPKWTAYELVLDVWPDVIAEGLLLLPKDIEPGERRPVVVQQGGGTSVPYEYLNRNRRVDRGVAARLADRGFVVFAPQNLYRGGDDFRNLDKKARSVKLTMWSLMLGQHDAILRWLETLAYVDSSRIGLYGCSFGGTTAMYIPPLLERYCLSICSANFNAWVEMIASTKWDGGYMTRTQWEFPMFNMGNTFSHAELAYLMVPRPFMVERGMYDTAAEDWQVASEYAKVRWLYTQLGIGDRTEIEFNGSGPHGFLCAGSFEFLHKHLRWPAPGN